MFERLAQRMQAERLSEDVRMDRAVVYERLIDALLDHFIELINAHLAEFARAVLTMDNRRRVVYLGGIRHAQQRTRTRAHPDRLIIAGPVHEILVARFLEQIRRS